MRPYCETRLPPVFNGIEAVCFDAFGTLVEITDKQRAFRPLFKALTPDKRRELKYRLMREDRPFTDWPKALGVDIAPHTLLEVLERMMIEAGSIALRPGVVEMWARLHGQGLRLAITQLPPHCTQDDLTRKAVMFERGFTPHAQPQKRKTGQTK